MGSGKAHHLGQAVGKNTAKARSAEANGVEERDSLLEVVAGEPCRDEEQAAGQEAGLEETQEEAETGQGPVVVREAEADLQTS